MEKILVPTDFSANAENAIAFAIEIANHFESELLLLHSFTVSSRRADVMKDMGRVVGNEAKGNMSKAVLKFKPKLQGKASIKGEVMIGSAVLNTAEYAEKQGCGLIVMGTQGATGALEVFIGSTTGGVLKNTSTPVLAIPSAFTYRPLDNIVLAVDNLPLPSYSVFSPLRKLASMYDARINIFHLKAHRDEEGVDRTIDSYFEGLEIAYHEESGDVDVHQRVNTFVRSTEANLLCMARRKRGFFEGLFKGSTTLKQAYNSPVPLLVLLAD